MFQMEAHKISYTYRDSSKEILKNIDFTINQGQKIALIGENGAGKSTLVNILSGKLSDYTGVISRARELKIGLVEQDISQFNQLSIADYLWQVREELAKLREQMSSDYELIYEYDEKGGYSFEVKVEEVIERFNLSHLDQNTYVATLSGGERTRLQLARLFLENVNLYILDEPTNHLDIEAIEWLEDFISQTKKTVLIIGHDRQFIENCANEVWYLNHGLLESFSGNYSFFEEQLKKRYQASVVRYQEQKRKIHQLQASAVKARSVADKMENFKETRSLKKNGGICKRDEGSASAKANPMKKMNTAKVIERRLHNIVEDLKRPQVERKLNLKFFERDFAKNSVYIETRDLAMAYDRPIFSHINFTIRRGEKIAIVGPNGAGKTTLLQILNRDLYATHGKLWMPDNLRILLLEQELSQIQQDSVAKALESQSKEQRVAMYNLMAYLGIRGLDVQSSLCELSLGQQRKIQLSQALLSAHDLLILDEPTNHFDIKSRQAIEEALDAYRGTLIFTCHDRHLVSTLADKVFDIVSGEYYDCYESYRDTLHTKNRIKKT